MDNPTGDSQESDEAWVYEIRVQGRLCEDWSGWFGGLAITSEETGAAAMPITTITGAMADQAALRGILTRLWNLNLDLISVVRLSRQTDQAAT